MRTHYLPSFLAAGLAIMIMGCQEQQNPVENPLSDQYAVGTLAKATVTTSNETIDFDNIINIPCAVGGAGEDVHLTGPLHVLFVTTVNNNRFTMVAHFQPQGIRGVGLTTGDAYQGTGVDQYTSSGSFVNGQATDTFVENFRIIGVGNGNNLLVHVTSHVTVNASGDVTADVEYESVECM